MGGQGAPGGVQTTELTVGAASLVVAVDETRELYSELLSASAQARVVAKR